MSYILDALRRADAERARAQGLAPGLHTQASALPVVLAPTARPRWPLLLGAALGGGLLVALAVVFAGGSGPWRDGPAAAEGRPMLAVAPGPSPDVVRQPAADGLMSPAPSRSPSNPTPPPTARTQDAPPVDGPASSPATVPPAADQATAARSAPAVVPGSAAAAAPTPTPAGMPAATQARSGPDPQPAAARAPALTRLADLPPALRQRLMGLQPGGVVHAATAAQRLVLINGQVFHEGEQPQPGLVLEQIRLKSLVFSLDGYRFEWPL
ncbi:general secretion pathway protein GspB [Pseudaquabacterium rugosum]|uniref:General secretion pathway protein GspB n=1 Tax=Pseudaquabacterium rugosum TaxID=2984194 RepID=A0ABU9BEP5_9BURK